MRIYIARCAIGKPPTNGQFFPRIHPKNPSRSTKARTAAHQPPKGRGTFFLNRIPASLAFPPWLSWRLGVHPSDRFPKFPQDSPSRKITPANPPILPLTASANPPASDPSPGSSAPPSPL